MRRRFVILIILVFVYSDIEAQIARKDSMPNKISDLIELFGDFQMTKGTFEKYIDIKYFPNRCFSELKVDIEENVSGCFRAFLIDKYGVSYRFNFCEYADSVKARIVYGEIKNVFVNTVPKKLMCFKAYNIFQYQNIICISQLYTDEYSIFIKRITGDFPLFVQRVNKHINVKERMYWNFERN